MFAMQWEVSLFIVVEDDFRPAFAVVAAITLFAELTLVNILYLVTVDAGLRGILVYLVQMACIACCLLMAMLQREICFAVIEIGFFPAAGIMTAIAFFALFTFMDIHLLMAAITVARRF